MRIRYHFPISDIPDEGLDLDFESKPAQINLKESEFRVSGLIHSRIRVEKAEETIILEGKTRGQLDLQCVRCIKPVAHPLDVSFRVFLEPLSEAPSPHSGQEKEAKEVRGGELDHQFLSGDKILMDEVIREQVMLGVPAYPVCRDECRGLCPVCGINRNELTCSCPTQEEEPSMNRLQEQLKKLNKKT